MNFSLIVANDIERTHRRGRAQGSAGMAFQTRQGQETQGPNYDPGNRARVLCSAVFQHISH